MNPITHLSRRTLGRWLLLLFLLMLHLIPNGLGGGGGKNHPANAPLDGVMDGEFAQEVEDGARAEEEKNDDDANDGGEGEQEPGRRLRGHLTRQTAGREGRIFG